MKDREKHLKRLLEEISRDYEKLLTEKFHLKRENQELREEVKSLRGNK